MNILFLSSVFPDESEPSRGTYNLATCVALAEDHHVHVIAPRPWPERISAGVSGHRISPSKAALDAGIEVDHPTYWYSPKVMRNRYGEFFWWSVKPTVEQLACHFRPDAVLSYWAHPDGDAAIRTARRFGVPAGIITGGSDVLLPPTSPRRGRKIRAVLNNADAVLSVSDGVRQQVINSGVNSNHVHTVYQGVDPDRFYPGDRSASRQALTADYPFLATPRPMLLWVGRMVDVKRLDVLIDASARIRQTGLEFQLCLIGSGPEQPAVTRQVQDLGLTDHVEMIGPLPPASLGNWYRAADLTVLTSDSEGLPNVLRETLACRTPFVATDVGSIRELAGPPWGQLVPPGDAPTLAEAIAAALTQPIADTARPPQTRTWEQRAAEIIDILSRCSDHRTSSPPGEPLSCS